MENAERQLNGLAERIASKADNDLKKRIYDMLKPLRELVGDSGTVHPVAVDLSDLSPYAFLRLKPRDGYPEHLNTIQPDERPHLKLSAHYYLDALSHVLYERYEGWNREEAYRKFLQDHEDLAKWAKAREEEMKDAVTLTMLQEEQKARAAVQKS